MELHKPTKSKQEIYEQMTEINTQFTNWLLDHPELNKAISKRSKNPASLGVWSVNTYILAALQAGAIETMGLAAKGETF